MIAKNFTHLLCHLAPLRPRPLPLVGFLGADVDARALFFGGSTSGSWLDSSLVDSDYSSASEVYYVLFLDLCFLEVPAKA